MILPSYISLTCWEDITIPSFAGVLILDILCDIHLGSEYPMSRELFKDGVLIDTFDNSQIRPIFNLNDDYFGTYTYLASSVACGHIYKVSHILRKG